MPQRIAVTGATGLLGNNLLRMLATHQHRVRILLRSSTNMRHFQGVPVEIVHGDVNDPSAVAQLCKDVHVVIHTAAVVRIGWSNPSEFHRVNVDGTVLVAEQAKQNGARFIYVSTVNALECGRQESFLGNEDTVANHFEVPCPYVISKRAASHLVDNMIADGLDAVIVYPGFMLGPYDWKPSSGQMLIESVRHANRVAPAGGCSVCDVRDVARAITVAKDISATDTRFILAGHNVSYFDLWTTIASIAQTSGPVIRLGPVGAAVAGTVCDCWSRCTGNEPLVNSAAIRMGQLFHYYSSARATEQLGYQVRPLQDTIADAFSWLRDEGMLFTGGG